MAASTLHSPQLGMNTTLAIALHNIPEGIAIAVPCMAARPDAPWLAFGMACLSGLAEPLGAMVAVTFMDPSSSLDNVLSFVAGVMVAVALLELFPESWRYGRDEHRGSLVAGALTGMILMVGTELYLES